MIVKISTGISRLVVKKIAYENDVIFPPDYIDFLIEHNGLFVGSGVYCNLPFSKVDDGEIDFQTLYGIGASNQLFDLVHKNDIRDEITAFDKPFIIGEDAGGNLYVISGTGQDTAVFYWDRMHIHFDGMCDYQEKEEEGNIYKLADSFTQFYTCIMNNIRRDE